MKREEWFETKWLYLKRFAMLFALGAALIAVGIDTEAKWLVAAGAFLIVPLIFFLFLVPLYHWKDRYVGERSKLWGALLLIETSGWFKIVYWFRHVVQDWKRAGRYHDAE